MSTQKNWPRNEDLPEMMKTDYDTDNDQRVDVAEALSNGIITILPSDIVTPNILNTRLANIANPEYALDATNKQYVDAVKGAFAYLPNPTNTTITTGGDYESIAGPFTNPILEDFSLGVDELVYDGLTTHLFEVDWHASFQMPSDSGRTIHFAIRKNDSTVISSIMGQFAKTSGETYALSGTCVVELSTNDTIQLIVTSDVDADVVRCMHYTTTICRFR